MKTHWHYCLPALVALAGLSAVPADSPESKSAEKHPEKRPAKSLDCEADEVWANFLDHLREAKHEDLIPPHLLPSGDEKETDETELDLISADPVKGILFKLSSELVNIDALYREAGGMSLSTEDLAKSRDLAGKLRESKDPFLEPYGVFYGAQADIQAGECAAAVKVLEGLTKSCFFLPRREAHRQLAAAYSCVGDDTLALLELQFYRLDLAPEDESNEQWVQEELKKIRDKKNPGPLHHSEESMRSISTLISGLEVREPTQSQQRRVEDILEKVAELLERQAAAAAAEMQVMPGEGKPGGRPVRMLVQGKKAKGSKPGQKKQKGDQGKAKSNEAKGKGAKESKLDQDESADITLRDASAEERDAWGKINDREVARSLKELWDKIPQSYRLMVTQYFKELSDPEPAKPTGK